jgi:hypothetical protein
MEDSMARVFDKKRMLKALRGLAANLHTANVEMVVVGGAAGILTDLFGESVTTSDIDVIRCLPSAALEDVLDAARKAAYALDLLPAWLSTDVGLYREDMMRGWEERKVLVLKADPLTVWAIGRVDLIAMKFAAHRTKDREHLEALHPTKEERAMVRAHLVARKQEVLSTDNTARGRIDNALLLVDAWGSLP